MQLPGEPHDTLEDWKRAAIKAVSERNLRPPSPHEANAALLHNAEEAAREAVAERQRRNSFTSSIHGALSTNPDEMAQIQSLSVRTGIPQDMLVHDYHYVDRATREQEISTLFDTNPRLAAWLSKPANANVSSDDIDRLKKTDDAFTRLSPQSFVLRETPEPWEASTGVQMQLPPLHFLEPLEEMERVNKFGVIRPSVEPRPFDSMVDAWKRGTARKRIARELRWGLPSEDDDLRESAAKLASLHRQEDWYTPSPASARAAEARSKAGTIGEYISALGSNPAALAESLVESFATQGEFALLPMAARVLGGIPGAATQFLVSGYTEFLSSLDETLLQNGVDQRDAVAVHRALTNPELMEHAKERAGIRAPIIAGFDALTFGLAGKILSKAKPTVSSVVTRTAAEGAMQGAGGAAGEAIGTYAVGEPFNLGATLDEFFLEIFGSGVEIATGTHNELKIARERKAKSDRAEVLAEFFEDLTKAVESSKVAERSPETMVNWLNQAGKEVPTVHLEAEALAKSGLADQVIAASPAVAEQFEAGGEMTIPTTEYLTKIAPLDPQNTLVDDLRLPGEEYTRREAMAAPSIESLVGKFAEAVQDVSMTKEFKASAREVEQAILTQLKDVGRFTDDQAQTYAAFVAAFASAQAADLKISPMEWYQRYPYKIERGGEQPGGMAIFNQAEADQPRTFSQAFKDFFGQSKVVDADGTPLVVYHGTDADFVAFKDGLTWATKDAKAASRFADRRAFVRGEEAKDDDLDGGVRTADEYVERFDQPGPDGQRVIPVYLSIQNLFDLTELGARSSVRTVMDFLAKKKIVSRAKDVDLRQWAAELGYSPDYTLSTYSILEGLELYDDIKAKGHDGIKLIDVDVVGNSVEAYAAFGPTQVKSALANQGTFDPTDPNILKQVADEGGPRGGFDPARLTTILHEKADLSTFLHETAHFFLTAYADQAARPDATPQMRQDMQTVLDWFGVKDLETWNAMTIEKQRRYHEQWAYNYEIYLFEGKAPSVQLQSIFDRFTTWLLDVYKTIKEKLNTAYFQEHGVNLPLLTGEVRQVMDRMLASRDQIAYAEQVNDMTAIFRTQQEAGMPDDQWSAYQLMATEATSVATATLARANLTQMRWLSRARSKILKRMQDEVGRIRDAMRGEVAKEVEMDPIYRAIAYIRRGSTTDSQGNPVRADGTPKLQTSAVKSLLPPLDPDMLKRMGYGPYGMLAEDGIHPDLVAPLFGFDSGDALVRTVAGARALDEEINARTDARMLQEHSDLLDPGKIEQAVQEALHNEARAQFIAVELRYLAKIGTPARVLVDAARRAARAQLANTRLRQLNPNEYRAAEARAARQSAAAAAAGDTVAASQGKHRQLFYNQLTMEALAIRKQLESVLKEFKTIFNRDATLGKAYDIDLVNAARFVLGQYQLGPKSVDVGVFRSQLEAYNADLYTMLQPVLDEAVRGSKDYHDLTLAEFRAMQEIVEALWYRAKRDKAVEIDGKSVQVEVAAAELITRLDEIGVPTVMPGDRQAVTARERAIAGISQIGAALTQMEHLVDNLDGSGGPGAFTRYLWRPVREAIDRYRKARNNYVKRYVAMLKALHLPVQSITAPELNYTFGKGNGGGGKSELLGAILHIGNISNKKKLLIGREWGSLNDDGSLNSTRWDTFLARMFKEGIVTKEDMDFVQATWDINEEMKPAAQAAHREVFGYYFKEIPATTVETPFGNYRGGYVPAKVDPATVQAVDIKQALDALEAGFRNAMPSTGHGFTKERQDLFNEKLSLDLGVMAKHIDEVVLFSHVQPAVRDVLKILRQRDFVAALSRIKPTAMTGVILPWLNRAARQITTEASGSKLLDAFFRTIRSNTGIALMFANLTNALQQVGGILPLLQVVKGRYVRAAMADYVKGPQAMSEFVSSLSIFMDDRLNSKMMEVQDQLNEILVNPSSIDKMKQWSTRHGYFLQMAFQNVVDLVAWVSAYNQAMESIKDGLSIEEAQREAVRRADAVVRTTQSSINPEDIASYQVGSPAYRTLIQFTGYFNTQANLQVKEYTKVIRDLGWQSNKGKLVYFYMLGVMAPALVTDAIVRTMGKGWDDDDGDGYLDVFMDWFFGSQIRYLTAMVPGGNILIVPFNAFDGKSYNDRMTTSPSVSALESGFVGTAKTINRLWIEDKELTGKNVRDIITLLSLYFGGALAVLGRPIGYAMEVERGAVHPTSAVDYVRGLITGKASDESKKK